MADNLEAHVEKYQEALAGYRIALLGKLAKLTRLVDEGEDIDLYIDLVKPESHADEYESVIAMLDMSIDSTTTLTMMEFRQYVEDKWSWKQQFQATAAFYSAS